MTTRRTISVLLATVAAATMSLAINPAPASALSWDCASGHSCYYDGANGVNRIWIAPSGGKCFNLGTMGLNDRISSIYNRGNGAVHLYNWVGYWDYLGSVPRNAAFNLASAVNNKTDRVCID
ncbi:peptidase inhibitor family I36 protein [Microtetraspora sp. AC03309]|uniref:peptidase inhibitor family I36 protein n=1 Tax=Microtetraspora sp. AC03309 TaxID=2779376 RepID=UPI001E5365D5|nr:peptidase inhibitor family I36 protein [Microtetraspora sp. AC03309]MCC5578590.1 peptidase inhibitor family I36 protein [Microtetraspora sp. AC03309]